jgi:hypothetical protein
MIISSSSLSIFAHREIERRMGGEKNKSARARDEEGKTTDNHNCTQKIGLSEKKRKEKKRNSRDHICIFFFLFS